MPPDLLIGLQLYDADAATAERLHRACEALVGLRGVRCVNLQFREGPRTTHPGIETATVLVQDSETVTGVSGRRRPLSREVFDALAQHAAAHGLTYFAFINSDIVVTQDAVAEVVRRGRETYAISRHDIGEGVPVEPITAGVDMFVAAVVWWGRHRRRFRPYIVGESCWDNVYTAIMMCHSDGVILNRDPLILHPRHEALWRDEAPAARYNGLLAALDARYFSLWASYWRRLHAARARGASAGEEEAIRHAVFVWRRSAPVAVRQGLRNVRALWRYRRLQAEWRSAAAIG